MQNIIFWPLSQFIYLRFDDSLKVVVPVPSKFLASANLPKYEF